MTKQKFYVVWKGRKTGVFTTWEECKAQVQGYEGAQYKSFDTLLQAQNASQALAAVHIYAKAKPAPILSAHTYIADSLAVDAACDDKGNMEYRGVWVAEKKLAFQQGVFTQGSNNIGEFLAIVHGLALLQKNNLPHYPVYTDSATALAWLKKKKHNSKIQVINPQLLTLLQRAEHWLRTHTYQNPVFKWHTEIWGEIPADFGRKK